MTLWSYIIIKEFFKMGKMVQISCLSFGIKIVAKLGTDCDTNCNTNSFAALVPGSRTKFSHYLIHCLLPSHETVTRKHQNIRYWWQWSSGQHAHLLLQRFKFKSRQVCKYSVKYCLKGSKLSIKSRPALIHFFKLVHPFFH